MTTLAVLAITVMTLLAAGAIGYGLGLAAHNDDLDDINNALEQRLSRVYEEGHRAGRGQVFVAVQTNWNTIRQSLTDEFGAEHPVVGIAVKSVDLLCESILPKAPEAREEALATPTDTPDPNPPNTPEV